MKTNEENEGESIMNGIQELQYGLCHDVKHSACMITETKAMDNQLSAPILNFVCSVGVNLTKLYLPNIAWRTIEPLTAITSRCCSLIEFHNDGGWYPSYDALIPLMFSSPTLKVQLSSPSFFPSLLFPLFALLPSAGQLIKT